MLLQEENRLFKGGVLQLAMTQWHLVCVPFKKHGVNTVEPDYNDIGLLRDFVCSVRYFVVPVNPSLLTIALYRGADKSLARPGRKKTTVTE